MRQAQEDVDSREFAEWMAFMAVEPMGEERSDMHAALLALMQASAYAGKGAKPKFADFLPEYWKEKKEQTPGQMKDLLKAFSKAVEVNHGERGTAKCGLGSAYG